MTEEEHNDTDQRAAFRPAVLSLDTSIDAERLQIRLWRRMSPLEKARATSEISCSAHELSLAGIRRRHPEASDHDCKLRLALITLGRELAMQVYPEIATLTGG